MGIENRKSRRIEVGSHRFKATFVVVHKTYSTGSVVDLPIRDFSETGVGMYVKQNVDLDTSVRILLDELQFAALEGKVMWCESTNLDPIAPPHHPYRVGIQFTPRDDSARQNQTAIFNYLENLSKKS